MPAAFRIVEPTQPREHRRIDELICVKQEHSRIARIARECGGDHGYWLQVDDSFALDAIGLRITVDPGDGTVIAKDTLYRGALPAAGTQLSDEQACASGGTVRKPWLHDDDGDRLPPGQLHLQ